MEITYEKLRSTKTKIRIAFVLALLGAVIGAAGGLYWRAHALSPTNTAGAIDFYLNFAGYHIGKWVGLWELAGGLGTGANTPAQVQWARNAYRIVGERGWLATIDDWHQIGRCAAGGALAGVALLGAFTKPVGESFSNSNGGSDGTN